VCGVGGVAAGWRAATYQGGDSEAEGAGLVCTFWGRKMEGGQHHDTGRGGRGGKDGYGLCT
jgi:hypothetical protein